MSARAEKSSEPGNLKNGKRLFSYGGSFFKEL
jgi:hypothetical protein